MLYSLGADMQNPSNTAMVQFLNHTANSASELPLSFFKSGQFLCLSPECQGGLIIHKSFYADFVGPGAAVGSSFDVNCTSVYVIGEVKFWVPATYAERQQAFQKRMAYSQQLQELVGQGAPLQRCALILNQLSQWVGAKEANNIPDELVARLAGVFTKTVKMTRKTYLKTPSQTQLSPGEGNRVIPTFCDRS
ncbi:MAG: hypothetical protein AB1589_38585 [Cyanobacteriota bacterium]